MTLQGPTACLLRQNAPELTPESAFCRLWARPFCMMWTARSFRTMPSCRAAKRTTPRRLAESFSTFLMSGPSRIKGQIQKTTVLLSQVASNSRIATLCVAVCNSGAYNSSEIATSLNAAYDDHYLLIGGWFFPRRFSECGGCGTGQRDE